MTFGFGQTAITQHSARGHAACCKCGACGNSCEGVVSVCETKKCDGVCKTVCTPCVRTTCGAATKPKACQKCVKDTVVPCRKRCPQ